MNNNSKLMIIEDDNELLLLYKDYFTKKGMTIIGTSYIAEEIEKDYEKFKPDIVILDYKLPGKNGLEAAKDILKKDNSAVIIILTAYDSVRYEFENEKLFRNKNMNFILKPIKLSELLKKIIKLQTIKN